MPAGQVTDRHFRILKKTKGTTMTDTATIEPQTRALEAMSVSDEVARRGAGTIVNVMAIVTPLLSFAVQNRVLIMTVGMGGSIHAVEIAMLAGSLIGVFLMPLILMLLIQIGKRYRNPRSRWFIFLNTALFFLVVSCLSTFVKL